MIGLVAVVVQPGQQSTLLPTFPVPPAPRSKWGTSQLHLCPNQRHLQHKAGATTVAEAEEGAGLTPTHGWEWGVDWWG